MVALRAPCMMLVLSHRVETVERAPRHCCGILARVYLALRVTTVSSLCRLARRCLVHVVAASIWRMAIGVTVILAGAAYVALRCLEDALDRPTLLVTT